MRDHVINLALVAAGVAAALGIAAVLLFALGDDGRSVNVYEGIYRQSADPVLQVELIPGANGVVNADGFIGRDYAIETPAGTWRVVGIGDSVTMYYSAERSNHLSLLESSLPAVVGGPVEVLNIAVAGYDTPQQVHSLRVNGLKYHPDFVIVGYCINDGTDFMQLARDLVGDDALGAEPDDSRLYHHRLIRQAVLSRDTLDWNGLFTGFVLPSERFQRALAALSSLADLAKAHGFGVLVLIFPALIDLDDYYVAPVHAALVAHATEVGLGVVDLAPEFADAADAKDLRTNAMDVIHPNPAGYRIAADAAQRWLADHRPWASPPADEHAAP